MPEIRRAVLFSVLAVTLIDAQLVNNTGIKKYSFEHHDDYDEKKIIAEVGFSVPVASWENDVSKQLNAENVTSLSFNFHIKIIYSHQTQSYGLKYTKFEFVTINCKRQEWRTAIIFLLLGLLYLLVVTAIAYRRTNWQQITTLPIVRRSIIVNLMKIIIDVCVDGFFFHFIGIITGSTVSVLHFIACMVKQIVIKCGKVLLKKLLSIVAFGRHDIAYAKLDLEDNWT